jgi:hypothetical protein
MPHLRLVQPDESAVVDDRPRVSLRLLMAASGRCSCDDCLLAYRAGNRNAGIIDVAAILDRSRASASLHAVR